MADTPAPGAGPPTPTMLFTPAIQTGSEVKVHRPRAGERGTWRVIGQVANTDPEDPAYDVTHTGTGRRRVLRASCLVVVRAATPPRSAGRQR